MSLRGFTSHITVSFGAIALSALSFTASANAAGDPRGIWYDHNGRGAVEIKECSSNAKRLCGHVVYVKKTRHKKRCGQQIIGNVRSNGRGWIYSPTRGRSFPLAMKRLSNNRLRIVGNAGSFFTKTYVWKRAPDSIVNCEQAIVAKAKVAPTVKPVAKAKVTPTVKPVAKASPATTPAKPKTEIKTTTASTDSEPGNASSATTALLATPVVAETPAPEAVPVATPEPEANTEEPQANTDGVDDLSPPGGLSDGGDDKLAKLESVIKKFTGGKGLKGLKGNGKSGGKCKYRIPYVGRTIRVKC